MSEHDQQVLVFDTLRLNESQHPELSAIFAIPNGGHRHAAVAGKLKAEGVKRGVSDICIPIPSGGFHGAYIEMKVKPNKVTPEQSAFLNFVSSQGYATRIAWSADDALSFIGDYLNLKLRGFEG